MKEHLRMIDPTNSNQCQFGLIEHFHEIKNKLMDVFLQVARKLVIVEGELERTEERAELAEA